MPKYLLFIASLLLTACGNIHFPGVYKINVEQGNIIDQEMIDQLKPGMSKTQVEYILGTALIKDTFNASRWDYFYSMQKGGGEINKHQLTVFFNGDKLSYYTGGLPATTKSESSDNKNEAEKVDKEDDTAAQKSETKE